MVRPSRVAVALLVAAGAITSSLDAQFCFRGRPLPRCRVFTVTEFGLFQQLHRTAYPGGGPGGLWAFEGGVMANLAPRLAFGGTALGGTDSDGGDRLGVKARVRWWLHEQVSLDFAPGILLGGTGARFPGATAHVAINWRDWLAFTAQVEHMDRQDLFGEPVPQPDTLWWVGAKVGSHPMVVVTGVLLAVSAIFLLAGPGN